MVYDSVFKVQFVAVSFSLRQLVQFITSKYFCQQLFYFFFSVILSSDSLYIILPFSISVNKFF